MIKWVFVQCIRVGLNGLQMQMHGCIIVEGSQGIDY